jgi:hypothetical protein
MRIFAAILLCAVLAGGEARANDTTAELSTGGLVFVPNDDVEMRAEDLFISAAQIRVRYVFFNKAKTAVTIRVAFPMPEIKIEQPDEVVALPTEDPVNMLAFTTSVNGKPVSAEVEQHVFAAGVDRTQYLRDLGVPLAPHLAATNKALDRLPPEKRDELVRLGLAAIEEYDVGKGMEKHLSARWALRTTFFWQQTFSPGTETVIEHRYKPSVGGSVQTSLGASYAAKEAWYEDFKRKYCIDADFLAAIERLRKAARSEYGPPYSEQRIDYILKTGANWAGPIKNFRLVVDKGDAGNLVSFCGEGVKKISPTQFEMRTRNFTPQGNFSVLILKKLPRQ